MQALRQTAPECLTLLLTNAKAQREPCMSIHTVQVPAQCIQCFNKLLTGVCPTENHD